MLFLLSTFVAATVAGEVRWSEFIINAKAHFPYISLNPTSFLQEIDSLREVGIYEMETKKSR